MTTKEKQFWKAKSSAGRKPIFKSPEQLWESSVEYFKWCEENPLYEYKPFHYQGETSIEPVPKMRAMTIQGLCLFLDIGQQTLADYGKKDKFSGVVKEIKDCIYTQKFSGAAADLLNSNIIARDLGLTDKQAVEVEDKTDLSKLEEVIKILEENGIDPKSI